MVWSGPLSSKPALCLSLPALCPQLPVHPSPAALPGLVARCDAPSSLRTERRQRRRRAARRRRRRSRTGIRAGRVAPAEHRAAPRAGLNAAQLGRDRLGNSGAAAGCCCWLSCLLFAKPVSFPAVCPLRQRTAACSTYCSCCLLPAAPGALLPAACCPWCPAACCLLPCCPWCPLSAACCLPRDRGCFLLAVYRRPLPFPVCCRAGLRPFQPSGVQLWPGLGRAVQSRVFALSTAPARSGLG